MNSLQKKIESGAGKLGNLKMYMPIEKRALFAVTVVGLRLGESGRLLARVRPDSGVGEALVEVHELVDVDPTCEELYQRKLNVEEYRRTKIYYTDNVTNLRSQVTREHEALSEGRRKLFSEQLKSAPVNKREKHDLRSLLSEILNVRHGLTADGNALLNA